MAISFDYKTFLSTLTSSAGVYVMYNTAETVLYVGKAKNLKKRLSSYFQKTLTDLKTQALVKHIAHIEVTLVHSETDALILENDLIKLHRPKYNILLRDDKSYPYILLSQHKHPRLAYHRGVQKEKGVYFGPYPNSAAVKESLHLMQKLFPIRQCEDTFYRSRSRPCLQYQIGRCLAPCVAGHVTDEAYAQQVDLVQLFLKGKSLTVVDELVAQMEQASHTQDYETAARLRDQISALTKMIEKQEVSQVKGDLDAIGVVYHHGIACLHILFIRQGKILGHRNYFPKVPHHAELDEVLRAFVLQFYLNTDMRVTYPKEVILPHAFTDMDVLSRWITSRVDRTLKFKTRVRDQRAQFLKLAMTNAEHAVQTKLKDKSTIKERFALLQTSLELKQPIARMECFDISHTQGEATVASCVVFNQEGPMTQAYRRFNIQDITGGDDYAAMRQVLYRRYKNRENLPDLILIDGGLGQLRCAEEVIAEVIPEVEMRPMLVGVAKGEGRKAGLEKLIMGESHDVIKLAEDAPALQLILQIRDESHRFAITGHRQKRQKARNKSTLESIPGVGAKRRQKLLSYLGGLQEVRNASVKQLAKVPGISTELAQIIFDALRDS
tara:strand:+ start:715 stop:2541 length:1827 start_codon:yes stop_codon:yes gene_type:complete